MAAGNGTVDLAERLSAPEGELGSAVDSYREFLSLDGLNVLGQDFSARRLDEMLRRDGKARSIEQALTLPLRSAQWSIEATDGDRGEAEFIRAALTRSANADGMSTPLELVLGQATSACLYRRAFFEKVFKAEDGRVVYDKLALRPAATCKYLYDRRDGAFKGFSQYVGDDHPGADEMGRITIAPDRAWVFVYGQHRRPVEGVSDLETVYSLYEAKQKVRFLWFVFLENQTMPKAVVKDESGDQNAPGKLARKVATLKGGGVVGIGKDQTVEPYETSNAAADAFRDAIRFLDSEMSGSVLAGFTDLAGAAASGRGSFALSSDQSDLFLQSRQAALVELGASLTNFVIADLCRWNFGISAAVPQFKFGPLVPEHADKALEMLQSLAGQERPLVPQEFIDMLIEKVASYLGLNADVVAKAIRARQAQAPQSPVAQFAAGASAADRLVRETLAAQAG